MCGLFGVLSLDRPVDESELRKGIGALRHRGPDGTGFFLSGDRALGLAHARLAIMDPAGGSQPLYNEDRSIVAVVNGEFYDFEQLREELEGKGHAFHTRSDSEILVHLYEEWGTGCISRLRGEFAFLLWDEKKKTLFAARDRFGIKPLLYLQDDRRFLFASEAKAFFSAGVCAQWDEEALFRALSLHYRPVGRTFFRGVRQLKPGHFLIAERGDLREEKYWDLDYPLLTDEAPLRSDSEWLSLFERSLTDSIRTRLRSDVPTACYLSGGIDSATVAAIARRLTDAPFDAFTISFSREDYDECGAAMKMAEACGVNWHSARADEHALLQALPDAAYFSEGLAINGHLSAKFLLSSLVRQSGIKVVLTGEGADELLAGYPHFQFDCRLPGAGELNRGEINRAYYASSGIMLSRGENLTTKTLREALGFVPEFMLAKGGFGWRMRPFLENHFSEAFKGEDPYRSILDEMPRAAQLQSRSPLHVSMYLWSKLALSNYILHPLGDGTEMAHSVEGRLPFLDHRLFELVKAAPQHLLLEDGRGKVLLRRAAKQLVIGDILDRPKHPFFSPPLLSSACPAVMPAMLEMVSGAKLPFIKKTKFIESMQSLQEAPDDEKKLFDPLLYMVLSMCCLEERFGL